MGRKCRGRGEEKEREEDKEECGEGGREVE